jgi:ATP-dependent protease HslVU (ClpYQ) peptidase subunit
MSIIVAVAKNKRLAVAADKASVFGTTQHPAANHTATKIRKLGTSILGVTGWALYNNILDDQLTGKKPPRLGSERDVFRFFLKLWQTMKDRYSFVNDQSHEADSPFADLDASFLVANKKGMFHVASNLTITSFRQYAAVGCGSEFALGALFALYPRETDAAVLARAGVEAAIAMDTHCGGDIDVIVL